MKTKIAILGGGISALATAYELKRLDASDALDITIYQMGWRLGGKCASSRNDQPGMDFRNEEHGLHVLGGWYHNTFEMLRQVYMDWNKLPVTDAHPIGTAFLPVNGAVLFDEKRFLWIKYGWRKLAVRFPDPVGQPGIDIPDLSIARMLRVLARWVQEILENAAGSLSLVRLGMRFMRHWFDISDVVKTLETEVIEQMTEEQLEDATNRVHICATSIASECESMLDDLSNADAQAWYESETENNPSIADLVTAGLVGAFVIKGMLADRLITRGFDYINSEDATEWLRRHGAPNFVVKSPFVELGYHYAFSYIDGDPNRPDMAAGAALRGYMRMFFGQVGNFFYHFEGGMGDVIVKPFYDVLKAKGVKFEFFNQITRLDLNSENTQISRIQIRRQAKVKAGPDAYDPLISTPKGLRTWPVSPLMDQLELGPGQTAFPDDFEDPFDLDENDPIEELVAGQDFDLAILAIPGTALKDICQPLIDTDPAWRRCLDAMSSCPTLSAQLWTERTPDQLGWGKMPHISTGHVLPLSTWSDMSHLIPMEQGHAPVPFKGHHLLCGPHPITDETPRETSLRWLKKHFRDVLPDWRFKIEELSDRALYARLNHKPSERYIFAGSGDIDNRLRTDESGLSNLYLCGDWVRNGTDLGWVEGAVTTARQCARAITGVSIRVYGETDFG
ncbi:MAG: FAD-dependent oxidoreductase [Pseudomonadota bacterium]